MLTYILMLEIGLWQRSNTILLLYSDQNAGE